MKILESRQLTKILLAAIGLTLFVLVNQLSGLFFSRWDLTEEKRYSINEATKAQLQALPDVVNIEVYLAGELPSGFKRMQKALIETLEEFAIYADDKISYQVIDPNSAASQKSRQNLCNPWQGSVCAQRMFLSTKRVIGYRKGYLPVS